MPIDVYADLWYRTQLLRSALRKAPAETGLLSCEASDWVKDGFLRKLWSVKTDRTECRCAWKDVHLKDVEVCPDGPVSEGRLTVCNSLDAENFCGDEERLHSQKMNHFGGPCAQYSWNLLPQVLLGPTKRLLFDPNEDFGVLWVTFMLFDEKATPPNNHRRGSYFYRTLRRIPEESQEDKLFLLMYRLPEVDEIPGADFDYVLRAGPPPAGSHLGEKWILNLSDRLRVTDLPSYALKRSHHKDHPTPNDADDSVVNCALWSDERILRRAASLRQALLAPKTPTAELSEAALSSEPFERLTEDDTSTRAALRFLNATVSEHCFNEADLDSSDLRSPVEAFVCDVAKRSEDTLHRHDTPLVECLPQVANYFVWLAATSERLNTYYIRHLYDFRFAGEDGQDRRAAFKPSGIVVASSKPTYSKALAARADLLLNTLLSPLGDYYALQNLGAERVAMYARGASHTLKNAIAIPSLRRADITKAHEMFKDARTAMEQDGLGTEYTQAMRGLSHAAGIANDIEFLRQQAEMMFWIMDPAHMADAPDAKRRCDWTISDLNKLLVLAVIAGIRKPPLEKLSLKQDADRQSTIQKLLALNYNDDLTQPLAEVLSPYLDITVFLTPPGAMLDCERRVVENIMFELITNAVARAASFSAGNRYVRIAVHPCPRKPEWTSFEVENSADHEQVLDLIRLWEQPLVYEESGHGGIAGLHQIKLLVERAHRLAALQIELAEPVVNCSHSQVLMEVRLHANQGKGGTWSR